MTPVERRPAPAPAPPATSITARSADELLAAAGVATYVADHELLVATTDATAMERWFERKPSAVYLYAERALEVPGATTRLRCQRAQPWESGVLNEVAVVAWRKADERTVVELGQASVTVMDQRREDGRWATSGARRLPVATVEWDDEKIRYAEHAEIHEVACVPSVREVACDAGGRAYCIDRELVVRPWLPPTVPHVGPVIPAYDDPVPDVPAGDCAIECEPSACDEALRRSALPREALYEERAPTLAAFRTLAACRAYAASRTAPASAGDW